VEGVYYQSWDDEDASANTDDAGENANGNAKQQIERDHGVIIPSDELRSSRIKTK